MKFHVKSLLQITCISFLLAVNACSKKDSGNILGVVPPEPNLTAYPIDLNFTINPYCGIEYDTIGYPLFFEKSFRLSAYCSTILAGQNLYLGASLSQGYLFSNGSFSPLYINIWEVSPGNSNYFTLISQDLNMFSLPYPGGTASFSGTSLSLNGVGRYQSLTTRNIPLQLTGIADTINNTGNFRLRGTVYF